MFLQQCIECGEFDNCNCHADPGPGEALDSMRDDEGPKDTYEYTDENGVVRVGVAS